MFKLICFSIFTYFPIFSSSKSDNSLIFCNFLFFLFYFCFNNYLMISIWYVCQNFSNLQVLVITVHIQFLSILHYSCHKSCYDSLNFIYSIIPQGDYYWMDPLKSGGKQNLSTHSLPIRDNYCSLHSQISQ